MFIINVYQSNTIKLKVLTHYIPLSGLGKKGYIDVYFMYIYMCIIYIYLCVYVCMCVFLKKLFGKPTSYLFFNFKNMLLLKVDFFWWSFMTAFYYSPEFTACLTLIIRSWTFSNARSLLFEILVVVILVCQNIVLKYDSHYIIHIS